MRPWGKHDADALPAFHPLVDHCLDVAVAFRHIASLSRVRSALQACTGTAIGLSTWSASRQSRISTTQASATGDFRPRATLEPRQIDFVLAEGDTVTDLVEVKLADAAPSAYMHRMAERLAPSRAVQVVADLRQPAQHGRVEVADAAAWLAGLAA